MYSYNYNYRILWQTIQKIIKIIYFLSLLFCVVYYCIIKTNVLIGQEDSLLEHTHHYNRASGGSWGGWAGAMVGNQNWESTGGADINRKNNKETRSVNFTYILWKRIS